MSSGLKEVFRIIALLIVICFALESTVLSQPGWVKELTQISLEKYDIKEAPALVLRNRSITEIKDNGSNISEREIAFKVLSPDGVEETYLHLPISPSHEVKDLKGWRISTDGSKQELKKEHIIITGFQGETGYYDDQRTLSATLPDVKTGDIVAYEYKFKEKPSWEGYYVGFVFQTELPVLLSYFELTVPTGWQIKTSAQNLEPITESHSPERYVWKSGFLPYRQEEPYMPDWSIVSRKITVGCYDLSQTDKKGFHKWSDVATWAEGIYAFDSNGPSISQTIAEVTGSSVTEADKLRNVAKWVQENIRYVAVELGEGRYQPRPAATTFSNKFGDCKDKSTLLGAMLAGAQISSRPALASVGKPVDELFPSPGQFNHVILSIPIEENKLPVEFENASVDGWLFFDPTDPITALGRLPTSLHGTKVLRINSSESLLVKLPDLSPEHRLRHYYVEAVLNADNSITADVIIKDFGNKSAESRLSWRSLTEDEHSDNYKKLLGESIKNLAIIDFKRDSDGDSSWVIFKVSGDKYLSEMGQLTILKPNFIRPDRNNLLTKEPRMHPVSFGAPEFARYEIKWKLPENYQVSGKIEAVNFSTDKASISCYVDVEASSLKYFSERTFSGKDFEVSEYATAQAIEKELNAANRLRIFLDKIK